MRPAHRSTLSGFLIATLAVAAVAVFRWVIRDAVGNTAPFIPFVPAVMLSAWYGGLKPGVLATILSMLVCHFEFLSIENPASTTVQHFAGVILFVFSGALISWLSETLHVTRRRLMNERKKLRASSERERARIQELEAILDAVPAAISIAHDPQCRRVTRSRAGLDLFGLMKETGELLPEEWALQNAARGEESHGLEMEQVAVDGERHILYGNAVALRDSDGEPRGAVGAFVDITGLKRAESAHQMGEARFRLLTQMIPSIVWMANPEGTITYANDALFEYSGLRREEDPRNWPGLVLHPEDAQRSSDGWEFALREGTEIELELRHRRHDGCYRWFLTRAVPMKDPAGQLISWFGVTTDIHDLKEMQQQLRDDDRRKDEFLATLAHELRNPLAPLRNSLEILKRSEDDVALMRQVRAMMERQMHHMVRMVDDLLDLSRLTRGRLELRKELFNLSEVLASLRGSECGQHRLMIEVPEQDVLLDADPIRVAQVFTNLLHNACKFSEPGKPIRVSAAVHDEQLIVSVKDWGIGIDPRMLDSVFEMFTQADRTLGRIHNGLGIGLTLVRQIVEMHSGTIEARSEGRGRGSEFIVRFPLRAQEPLRATAPLHPAARVLEASVDTARHRILVVDDNADAAESLAVMLRVMGHETFIGHDGKSALALIPEI
ncbi:MAG TPA: ATP-binding protein, partial [bacterium]|nr:ATP-binding protein [bacterium]